MKPFLLIIYLCFSVLAVCLTAYDKYASVKKRFRVPEKTLFFVALCGGSAAMYITMLAVHHKTKHKRFMIGLPLMALAQIVLIVFVL